MGPASAENIQALERELKAFILKSPDMITKPGETCFYQCPASAVRVRASEIGRHEGITTITNKKSISQLYGSGQLAGSAGTHRKVAEKYPGMFFITNQRFLLMTAPHGFDLALTDIFIINFYSDGFAIMAKGRTYMVETLHANRIREFLQGNMHYISYYKEIADRKTFGLPIPATIPYADPAQQEEAYDFKRLKLSLDLLCGMKTPAAVVTELTEPPPKTEQKAEEKKPKKPWQKKAADVILWLLALFLAFYFVFPLMMEVELEDVKNAFTSNGNSLDGFTITTGPMKWEETTYSFENNIIYTLEDVTLQITSAVIASNGVLTIYYDLENTGNTAQSVLLSSLDNRFYADGIELPLSEEGRYADNAGESDVTIAGNTELKDLQAVYTVQAETPLSDYNTFAYVTAFKLLNLQGVTHNATLTLTMEP